MGILKQMFQKNKMSLIVSLPNNKIEFVRAAQEAGADGIKFHIQVDHRASGNKFRSLNDYKEVFKQARQEFKGAMGLVLGDKIKDVDAVDLNEVKELGFDYYSLYAGHISSSLINQELIEKTFAIGDSFSIEHLGDCSAFGVEALEVSTVPKDDYGKPLNFSDLLLYRAYADRTSVPVIIPSQKKLVAGDVRTIHQAGAKAIMLGAVVTQENPEALYQAVSDFRRAIDAL
ncbi:beta/alpha barrel domain-containing protein [Paenibacillus senegalensis]|uniref:hypothetical protein n=1 Tax=Paenibacillus senegalensis TaxID=1465766 RepID=UPI0002890CCE|nr:hypothetical protein [Paenibacillus senegalensis]